MLMLLPNVIECISVLINIVHIWGEKTSVKYFGARSNNYLRHTLSNVSYFEYTFSI